MRATSFMSEHTAEYALVPSLVTQLGERFPRVAPVYFWATREGGRVGRESMNHHAVRIVAAFPRRPKVLHPGDGRILVKLNDVLFAAAHAGAEVGIPVLAGVPLVNDLASFSIGSPCSWFHISATSHLATDHEFLLPLVDDLHRPILPQGVAGPLTQPELVDIAESLCEELDWVQVLDGMRHVKSAGGIQHPIFSGGYRPFFLLLMATTGSIDFSETTS
jgi:hypothetical protein